MRLLDQIVGHQEITSKLLDSFVSGQPAQTFLFVGPSGVGKKQVALGLAQALLCQQDPRACGRCAECLRVEKLHHESLKIVETEGPQIKIEEARQILEFLSLRSLTPKRVIVIDHAQLMNPQTANALLKILEEPPEGTVFFLIAPAVAGILPTIRSRSRIVRFKPVAEHQMKSKSAAPAWALKASQGSFERLADLQEQGEQELRRKAAEVLQLLLLDPDFLLNETWRENFKDRMTAHRLIHYWISFLRDVIVSQKGGLEQVLNQDQSVLIKNLSVFPSDKILFLLQECVVAEQGFVYNQDAVLLTEKLAVQTRRAFYVD
ncbi:MAG: ATP-binding protein [Bdellovibrionia bacterium]